jgi:hypothetical protein
VQIFIGLLQERVFYDMAEKFDGYDVTLSGKIVYPLEH